MTLALIDIDPNKSALNLMPRANFDNVEKSHDEFKPTEADKRTQPTAAPFKKADVDKGDSKTWNNTPRNAPCPCGSGKKYKHCHGAISESKIAE